ncbi:MAG: hypothetical protein RBS34_02765 [Desulfofustis sp.]|jgi:hypothetical protein|nr:hypothetical protein [Desulfofustis sp.]
MPIYTEDVKLMASQRLTDNDDGGGRMTGIEIVDGNVNNLFPDISRLDRVYGRVSLRKAFVHVNTPDQETYSGAHVILSKPAADPKVNVCMFTTGDPHDERTAARNRLESYVTLGPRYPGWLWGDQPAGARSVMLFQIKGSGSPGVGDVLVLFNNRGLANEEYQYVRITKVELTTAEFATSEYTQALSFNREVLKLEIGDPLRYTFKGIEVSRNDALPTSVYTTLVSDAAKYYGVMLPTQEINQGDISLLVDSIYTHLVPSAQGEAPMVDLSVGEAGPVIGSGQQQTVTASSFTVQNEAQLYFGTGIKPGSLTVQTSNGRNFTDDGNGVLYEGEDQRGLVDYSTGAVTFRQIASSFSATVTMTAVVGVEVLRVPSTTEGLVGPQPGYNYVAILNPLPIPGSVWVDFMAQGKWYRLRDDGKGYLVPDIANTGSGTINYLTGSIIVTCGALPDPETVILFNWANPIETVDLSGTVTVDIPEIVHQLASAPVKPGSVAITWPVGVASTGTAVDNGSGVITGDAAGSINYATGKLVFRPASLIVAGGQYEIDYEKYPYVDASLPGGSGTINFSLPSSPIKPGTLNLTFTMTIAGLAKLVTVVDDGAGNLSAPAFTVDKPASHPSWPGSSEVEAITGTIDYITGAGSLNVTLEVAETWRQAFTTVQYASRSIPTA